MSPEHVFMTICTFVGTFLFGSSALPQVVKTIKTKATAKLSLGLYLVLAFSTICLFFYGLGSAIVPQNAGGDLAPIAHSSWLWSYRIPGILIVICEVVLTASSIIIVFYKVRNMIRAEKLQLSEAEYENIYIYNTSKQNQNLTYNKLSFNQSKVLKKIVYIFTIFGASLILISIAIGIVYAVNSDLPSDHSTGIYRYHPLWGFIFGIIGNTGLILSYWNGFQKYYYTRDTSQMSMNMWVITATAKFILGIYYLLGVITSGGSLTFIIMFVLDLGSLFISLVMMGLKIKNMLKAKKQGISEKEYCDELCLKFTNKKAHKQA